MPERANPVQGSWKAGRSWKRGRAAVLRAVSTGVLLGMLPVVGLLCGVGTAQAQAGQSAQAGQTPTTVKATGKPTAAGKETKAGEPVKMGKSAGKATGKTVVRRHRRKAEKKPKPAAVAAVPQIPPPPPPPDWPALKAALPATVHWDGHVLSVVANNSSLQQVVQAVSAETHIPVTGLASDSRLFGSYGPGAPRQVLGELLEGSGYNVLMIGGSQSGIPERVELSARGTGSDAGSARPGYNEPQPAGNAGLAQQQMQPPGPPNLYRPQPPGMTPQQFLEQRRQMMQQQGNPPQNPRQ